MARHSLYTFNGGRIVARRTWDSKTPARYERMQRAAEAAGNYELAAEWEERGQRFRQARHHRRMDLLHSPIEAAKGVGVSAGMGMGVLVALGVVMAINNHDVRDVITPLKATVDFIATLIRIVQMVWPTAVVLGPLFALLALWMVGSKQQAAPTWALPANVRNGEGEPITPSIVVKACATSVCPRCATPSRRWVTLARPCWARSRSPGAGWKSTSPCRPGCRRSKRSSAAASWRRTSPGTSTRCSSPSRRRPAPCGCGLPTPGHWTSRSARRRWSPTRR